MRPAHPDLSAFDTPEYRLLILSAKTALSPAQKSAAKAIVAQVHDWDLVLETAERNFSLPSLRRHIRSIAPTRLPDAVRARLDTKADMHVMRNMTVIAAQRRFKQTVLDPLQAEAIFFKGIMLVSRYYPDLGLRPCRDIDVLVRPEALRRIVRHAVTAGYALVAPSPTNVVPLNTDADIDAALALRDDAILVSPDRVVIDLQTTIDKHSGIFRKEDLFAMAEPVPLGGVDFLSLPAAFLFNYVCHHHARHVWSRLHWLSDLDALVAPPDFDRDATLATADRLGQRGTVEASLELQCLMDPSADWSRGTALHRGRQFLDLALHNLEGDLDVEKRIGFNLIGGEFMFPWQARPALLRRARVYRWLHVLRPTLDQYVRHPLPRGLRWLYHFERIVTLLRLTRQRATKAN